MRNLTLCLVFHITLGVCQSLSAAPCTKEEHDPVDLAEYYQSAEGLSGTALKAELNQIVRGHRRYSYSPCVWTILKEADEDPDNPDNVIGFYTRRSLPKSDQESGQNGSDSWNLEHIWAKSHGFPSKGQHAYTDGHHLRVADRSVNSDRNDHDFDNGGERHFKCTDCRVGDATWEPPDEVKGDVARMMFYMATRYEGDDQSNTGDLVLVDTNDTPRGTPGRFGKLYTLLQWHIDDPVDASERARNDVIHSWQGNRNPYIDHPEFAANIWEEGYDVDDGATDLDRTELLRRLDAIERELGELRALIQNQVFHAANGRK